MDLPAPQSLADRRDDIAARRRMLEQRLDDGYHRIEHALRAEDDVEAWENFWLHLLHEYETVCDELDGDALAA